MSTDLRERYGTWAIVAGGSDGVGAAFANELAVRGMNIVLVARRAALLEDVASLIRSRHDVEVRTATLDLTDPAAMGDLARRTSGLDIGVFVFNAGADRGSGAFLDRDLASHLHLIGRNCGGVLEAAHRFGGPMVERGRGALVLINSMAAWVGGAGFATYSATKSFDLILAEGLWAEWHDSGVDVLAPVLGVTDTPAMRQVIEAAVLQHLDVADPVDVAREVLDHLRDGPTGILGGEDPAGGSPFGDMGRREAVLTMVRMSAASGVDA